jgi:hypothetical protein
MTITGTGKLQVQMTGAVNLGAPDAAFVYEVDPVSFASYFIGITTPADSSQNHVFQLKNGWANTVRDAMDNAVAINDTLSAATDPSNRYHPFEAAGGKNKLENYLKNWAQTNINTTLLNDQISAFLSAEEIKDLAIDDLAAAFNDSKDALKADLDDQEQLSLLAYQFKESSWMADVSGDSVDPTALPFKAGDSLTFRFNVSSSFSIDLETLGYPTVADQDAAGQPTKAMPSAYVVPSRAVDIVLNFVASEGAVTVAAGGEAGAKINA